MDKLNMHSMNITASNIEKIAALFPSCVTETLSDDGMQKLGIDFDKLRLELGADVIDEYKERYQFTWPNKRDAIRLANSPINKTLRPCREESVDFENTKNLYIEGDNLEALKLLQENYLGKVKMIYIDPPYNTGNDFVYKDKRVISAEDYIDMNGQQDEEGNQLVKNTESNGRFHTDWLNFIYPRLKVAKNLLTEDGAIFMSIDDNEHKNLITICEEIFGENNYVASIPWRKRTAKSDVPFGVSQDYEWIVVFARSSKFKASVEGKERKYFETPDYPGHPWRVHDMSTQRTALERPNSNFTMVNPKNGEEFPVNPQAVWRVTKDGFPQYLKEGRIVFPGDYDFLKISRPVLRYWKEDDMKKAGEDFGRIAVTTKLPEDIGMSQDGTKEITELFGAKVFSYPKPTKLIKYLASVCTKGEDYFLDFFSGSASSALSIMNLNAEDGACRRFILVQLDEKTEETSDAYKAGYKNICEIGKERIRRSGRKIKEENPNVDTGFRVLKIDESNMENVYYTPAETLEQHLFADNIKPDRTPEDLLFQIMPECAIELSAKIETTEIAGKTVFNVEDGYLMACFDEEVNEDTITAIAKQKPAYFVMRDSGVATDNVVDNFDQIFKAYSPDTKCKIL